MPNRLTRPGLLAYAAVTLLLGYQAVGMIRSDFRGSGQTLPLAALLAVVLATGGLFAVAAVTRRPLVGDDDHLLTRYGWIAVIGLTGVALVVVMATGLEDFGVWPNSPAIFVPPGVRRLEQAYFEGVEETRRAAAAARADEQ